jgi:hypothetical protein
MEVNMENSDQPREIEQSGYDYIVIATIALGFFISIVLVAAIAVYIIKQPAKPKLATLIHPSGDMVVFAQNREDLEQAMDSAEDWAGAYISSAMRGEAAPLTEEVGEMYQLLAEGRIQRLYGPVQCEVLKTERKVCKVRITEGTYNGYEYWVPKACVVRN